MFQTAHPNVPASIIVEDDFLFSPDFYEYFHGVARALDADPTLWLASAWVRQSIILCALHGNLIL